MTINKWYDILCEETREATSKISTIDDTIPESWPQQKEVYLNFIKAMDEATEVYNMENKENN